ncbi:hypothetical protein SD70_07545 [Gordoniibacillus kamchatkensis]|uniref:GGDEF domain-containing protein n=1 Tax=Gordoniibacillus kamchatkensis TaxID=1590651 RepID=A0ABR5AKC4_9BACL|nr:diguanylate cyclase [Paenibacillus sp. VKM B-2647]KIL41303.1 hypothetical protein SD70_07545 [Paenibacillus sp. VKM B-2647]
MKTTDRVYFTLFAQFLFIVFAALYLVFTIQLYPANYVWFLLTLLLAMFGFMRDLLAALLASMFIVFAYSSLILYQMFIEKSVAEIVLNDLVWLFAYPLSATVSGFLGREFRQLMQSYRYYADNYDKLVVIDEITGFLNMRNFMQELQEEVSRSLRYKREVSLLFVEVAYFKDLAKEYGKEQAQELIRKAALGFEKVLRDVDKKAYLDEGVFAFILPETPAAGMEIVKNRMAENFQSTTLNRSKREVVIKLRLKFGGATCPEQGTGADAIYEKAKQELSLYVG